METIKGKIISVSEKEIYIEIENQVLKIKKPKLKNFKKGDEIFLQIVDSDNKQIDQKKIASLILEEILNSE